MTRYSRRHVNPIMFTGDPAHMALGDYLHAIGDESGRALCQATHLPLSIILNIEAGHPVALAHVTKIAQWLSQQYQRHIQPQDIANLYIINPGRELPAPSPAAGEQIGNNVAVQPQPLFE